MKIIYKGKCNNCTSTTVVSINMDLQMSKDAMKVLEPTMEKNTVIKAQCCICKKPMDLEFVKIATESDRAIKKVKEEE